MHAGQECMLANGDLIKYVSRLGESEREEKPSK